MIDINRNNKSISKNMRKLKNSEYTETVGGRKNNKPDKLVNFKNLLKGITYAGVAATAGMLFIEMAWAAKFDIDAGVNAATKPLIDGIEAHWGKGVLLTGAGSALIGEGDARQRAIRAGIGCGAAGAVVLGLIALLK